MAVARSLGVNEVDALRWLSDLEPPGDGAPDGRRSGGN
jgi:hypothetical protein